MTPLQLALRSTDEMDFYLENTKTQKIINDIKEVTPTPDRIIIATAAMQGLCALPDKGGNFDTLEEAWESLAQNSVMIADALIAELNKKK